MSPKKVKLLWVEGEDAEEFTDLFGKIGILRERPMSPNLVFNPEPGAWGWVTLAGGKATEKQTQKHVEVRVKTDLGNTWVFRQLESL